MANTKRMATKEDFFDGNPFINFTHDELKEAFQQYRSYWCYGWVESGTVLDKAREELCAKNPLGVIMMEKYLLWAIAVEHFFDVFDDEKAD